MEEVGQVSAPEAKFPPALLLAKALQAALRGTEGRVEEGGNPAAYRLLQFLGAPGAAQGLEKIGYEGMSGAVGPNGVLWDTRANVPHMNSRSVDTAGAVSPFVGGLMKAAKSMAGAQSPGRLNAILFPVQAATEEGLPLGAGRWTYGGTEFAPLRTGGPRGFAVDKTAKKASDIYPELRGSRIADYRIFEDQTQGPNVLGWHSKPDSEIGINKRAHIVKNEDVGRTLDHELTHAVQAKYGFVSYGSSGSKEAQHLPFAKPYELNLLARTEGFHPEVLQRLMDATDQAKTLDHYENYKQNMGEILARWAERVPHSYDDPQLTQDFFKNFSTLVHRPSFSSPPIFNRGTVSVGISAPDNTVFRPDHLLAQMRPRTIHMPEDLFARGLARKDPNRFVVRDVRGDWVPLNKPFEFYAQRPPYPLP